MTDRLLDAVAGVIHDDQLAAEVTQAIRVHLVHELGSAGAKFNPPGPAGTAYQKGHFDGTQRMIQSLRRRLRVN